MINQKILILGSDGSLGKELVAQFTAANISFIGANRQNFNFEMDDSKIIQMFKDNNIYLIFNCVAMIGLDNCNKDRKGALWANYYLPKKIANISKILNINLYHFSTDNVFSCIEKNFTYDIHATPYPLTWYGITKYLGEQAVIAAGKNIIRIPMLFGPTNENQLISKLIAKLKSGDRIQVSKDIFTTPTYTPDIVGWICNQVISHDSLENNIVHLTGDKLISLYDFVCALAEKLGLAQNIDGALSDDFPSSEYKPKYGGLKSNHKNTFSFDDSIIKFSNFLQGALK